MGGAIPGGPGRGSLALCALGALFWRALCCRRGRHDLSLPRSRKELAKRKDSYWKEPALSLGRREGDLCGGSPWNNRSQRQPGPGLVYGREWYSQRSPLGLGCSLWRHLYLRESRRPLTKKEELYAF